MVKYLVRKSVLLSIFKVLLGIQKKKSMHKEILGHQHITIAFATL